MVVGFSEVIHHVSSRLVPGSRPVFIDVSWCEDQPSVGENRTMRSLSYSDRSLSSASGRKTAFRRIEAAIGELGSRLP